MSCGANHVAAVHSSGELYTWGFGSAGRLGHDISGPTSDPRADANRPTVVRVRRGAALYRGENCAVTGVIVYVRDGSTFCFPFFLSSYSLFSDFGISHRKVCLALNACMQVRGLLGFPVVGVAAGYAHSAAITADARLFVWGSGATGKLGLGPVTGKEECYCSVPTPIVIGDSVSALGFAPWCMGLFHLCSFGYGGGRQLLKPYRLICLHGNELRNK